MYKELTGKEVVGKERIKPLAKVTDMKELMKLAAFFAVGMAAALLLKPGVLAHVQMLLLQIIYF